MTKNIKCYEHNSFWLIDDFTAACDYGYVKKDISKTHLIAEGTLIALFRELAERNRERTQMKLEDHIAGCKPADIDIKVLKAELVSEDKIALQMHYPDFAGRIQISDIAFSTDCRYALLFFSWAADSLSGDGTVYLLKYNSRRWEVIFCKRIWML